MENIFNFLFNNTYFLLICIVLCCVDYYIWQRKLAKSSTNGTEMTLTDFTLHFSCCFTKILHSQLNPLLNNFTMQEKCY